MDTVDILITGRIPKPTLPSDKNALVYDSASSTWKAAYPPGYEYAYTEFTSNVSVTATTAATANTVVTGTSVTFDGSTAVIIEFFTPLFEPPRSGAGAITVLELYDGSSPVGALGTTVASSATEMGGPASVVRRLTPSAGAHTYGIRGWVSAGTGLVGASTGGAGVSVPGYIRITKA